MKGVIVFRNLACIIEASSAIDCNTRAFNLLAEHSREDDAISLQMSRDGEVTLYLNDQKVDVLQLVEESELAELIRNRAD